MSNYNVENRQIRVFISSTFRDMQDERDYLIKRVFPALKEKAAKREVSLVVLDLRWGITEQESKNGKVIDICLKEIENSFPFFIGLIGDRYGWCPSMDDVKGLEDQYDWLAQDISSGLSVTEIEMQYGVLRNPHNLNAFFYLKHNSAPVEENVDSEKLNHLKQRVRNNGRYPVKEYSSIEDLGRQITSDFTETLDRLYPEKGLTELERLRLPHRIYLNKLREFYIPDEEGIAFLDSFLLDDSRICCIGGKGGTGKSSLFANWIKKHETDSDYYVVYHKVGLGECGNNVDRIIERIDNEIDSRPNKSSEKVMVAIDGLFSSSLDIYDQGAFYENYLLRNKIIDKIIIIDPFEINDLEECDRFYCLTEHRGADYWRRYVREYLKVFRKRLSGQQMESIVSNPLMRDASILRVFLDEIISYGHYESLSQHISDLSSVSSSEEFYQKYLESLEQEYGIEVVRPVLGCLSISRYGLTYDMFARISGTNQLRCSQFYNAIKGFLMASEGGRWSLMGIDKAIRTRYDEEFRWQVINACDNESSRYAFAEKCYQLYLLGEYDRLLSLLPQYASFGLSQQEYARELLFINHNCSSKVTGPEIGEYHFIIQILSLISSICCDTNGPQVEIDGHSLWEYATSIPLYYKLLNEEAGISDTAILNYTIEFEKLASNASEYLTKRLDKETDKRKRKRLLGVLSDLRKDMKDASREPRFIKYGELAEKHLRNNDYSSAAEAFETQAKYVSDFDTESIQNCYHQAATAYVNAHDSEAAERAYSKSIELLHKLSGSDNSYKDKEVKELLSLGKLYMRNGGTEDGIRCFNIALSIYDDMLKTSEKQLLDSIRLLYAIHHRELPATADDAAIVDWYRAEATHGAPEMQYRYGRLCETGAVVEKNFAEAFKWYSLAAERGYPQAQHRLALMLYLGNGVPENHEMAFKWYLKAAENGHLAAQHMVGAMFYDGDGTEQCFESALKWYTLAAEGGNHDAGFDLGLMYLRGQGTEKNEKEAARWIKEAAGKNVEAKFLLGKMYLNGVGVEKDEDEAFRLIGTVAAKDNVEAIDQLAALYATGTGCEADLYKAVELYTKAAQIGKPESQHKLATFYASGKGVETSLEQAVRWNEMALKTYEKEKGPHNPKTIAYNNDQAWYYYLMGEYENALTYISNAVNCFLDTTPTKLKATVFETQGDILKALEQTDKAKQSYQNSLSLFESILTKDDERLDDLRLKVQCLYS